MYVDEVRYVVSLDYNRMMVVWAIIRCTYCVDIVHNNNNIMMSKMCSVLQIKHW